MKYLNREDILNKKDIKTQEVKVPEWGGAVVIKMLSGKEMDEYESSCLIVSNNDRRLNTNNVRAKLVAKAVVDPETFECLFTPADVEALGNKSAAALDRIFQAVQRLNKRTDADIEELEKN